MRTILRPIKVFNSSLRWFKLDLDEEVTPEMIRSTQECEGVELAVSNLKYQIRFAAGNQFNKIEVATRVRNCLETLSSQKSRKTS